MKCNYDAVFFDFDGTFADTGEGIFDCIQYAVNALGRAPLSEKTLRTFIGPPIFDSFMRELNLTEEEGHFAVEKYRERYSQSGIYKFRIYPGTLEVIRDIKESGARFAIVSSKPVNFIERIIDFLEIGNLVDCVSCPENDKAKDDKSVLINRAADILGIDKSKILMVGDRHFDINGANRAGVKSVGVTYGYGSEEELREADATHIAHSTAELQDIIFCRQTSYALPNKV